MSLLYSVRQGDGLARIAYQYGFFWETLWNHPSNAKLKTSRKEPEFLLPGDVLYIPDKRLANVSAPVDQQHRFRVKTTPARFNLQLLDEDNPRAGVPFVLEVDDLKFPGTTDGEGWIRVAIPPDAMRGRLRVGTDLAEEYELDFGYIDPVDTITGLQSRLLNLGIYDGAVDGEMTDETLEALRRFQKDNGLPITGQLDDSTRAMLRTAYEGNA